MTRRSWIRGPQFWAFSHVQLELDSDVRQYSGGEVRDCQMNLGLYRRSLTVIYKLFVGMMGLVFIQLSGLMIILAWLVIFHGGSARLGSGFPRTEGGI